MRRKKHEAAYQELISEINSKKIVYVDECGISHGMKRDYGWCEKGKRLYGVASSRKDERTNVITAWSEDTKIFASSTYSS